MGANDTTPPAKRGRGRPRVGQQVTVRIPPDDLAAVQRIADEWSCAVAEVVRVAVAEWLARQAR